MRHENEKVEQSVLDTNYYKLYYILLTYPLVAVEIGTPTNSLAGSSWVLPYCVQAIFTSPKSLCTIFS
jgi:hypothetical protein